MGHLALVRTRIILTTTRSLDVQLVPAGGDCIFTALQMTPQSVSTGDGLEEISANTFQVSRLRVAHFMTHEEDRFKDEIEQRRECKAELLSSCCCGSRANTLNQTTQKWKYFI